VLDARVEAVRRGPRGRHLPPDTGADGVPGYTRWIVQELVTEAVLEHEVAEAGLGRMTLDSVVALVDRVTDDVSVPEAEIRSYYERNDDLFRDADGSPRPYAEVRAAIEAELLGAARVRAFGEWLDVRRHALAQIEPAYAHPGDPVHGLPSHRH
jgi:[acyl-carrier-protein] S-malonyltransferase